LFPILTLSDLYKSIVVSDFLMQHNVIKFISDLRQVRGFPWVCRFPLPINLTATI
jgi:hypothetical protein